MVTCALPRVGTSLRQLVVARGSTALPYSGVASGPSYVGGRSPLARRSLHDDDRTGGAYLRPRQLGEFERLRKCAVGAVAAIDSDKNPLERHQFLTSASSSISATDRPTSALIAEETRIAPARSAATAMSLRRGRCRCRRAEGADEDRPRMQRKRKERVGGDVENTAACEDDARTGAIEPVAAAVGTQVVAGIDQHSQRRGGGDRATAVVQQRRRAQDQQACRHVAELEGRDRNERAQKPPLRVSRAARAAPAAATPPLRDASALPQRRP
jgi:hypothetical protein